MTSALDLLHEDCIKVSNATVVCEDGVILTHKLILASFSTVLKNLISEIPFGDEVTVFLKDFTRYSVNKLLTKSLCEKESKEEEAICQILGSEFGYHTQLIPIKKKNEKTKLALKKETTNKELLNHIEVKKETFLDGEHERILHDDDDDFDNETLEKIREYKREMIENPMTPKHIKINKRIEKKITFEKAIYAYKSGRETSVMAAAKVYGVCDTTLSKFIREGRGFQGQGLKLKIFTLEEEKNIVDKVKGLAAESGSKLTSKLLQRVIQDEAAIIMTNQPERSEYLTRTFNTSFERFTYNFAARNKLILKKIKGGRKIKKIQDSVDDFIEEDEEGDPDEKVEQEYDIDMKEETDADIENDCFGDTDAQKSVVKVQHVNKVDFDKEIEEKIREFEKEMVQNPITPKDIKFNQKIEKKIRFEKAISDVKSGRVTAHAAAKVHGVCYQTLSDFIRDGRGFKGPGKKLGIFTQEEEKFIADRLKKLAENGSKLTMELLQKVIREEADIVLINQPERSEDLAKILDRKKLQRFGYNFATRQNLPINVEKKKEIDERRSFECEVCYKKFAYKSGCVYHMRTAHSFLYSGR